MRGGEVRDVFAFSIDAGNDIVLDIEDGVDKFDFSDFLADTSFESFSVEETTPQRAKLTVSDGADEVVVNIEPASNFSIDLNAGAPSLNPSILFVPLPPYTEEFFKNKK